jgi:hypothetical protein
VDRHQRVEREREEAESRGPDPASPLSRSHSGAPALGVLLRSNPNGTAKADATCASTKTFLGGSLRLFAGYQPASGPWAVIGCEWSRSA